MVGRGGQAVREQDTQAYTMITPIRGDIFRCSAQTLVNPVNCVGVMGKGLALQFRHAFPGNYEVYRKACAAGVVRPGSVLTVRVGEKGELPEYIINFPTKRHWRQRSLLTDVRDGLKALREEIRRLGIRSVAVPPLGCGLGGLKWEEVRKVIEKELFGLTEVQVLLFRP